MTFHGGTPDRSDSPIDRAVSSFSKRFPAGARTMDIMHSTDYVNTFIAIAEDCPAAAAHEPPERAEPSVAGRTFRMIAEAPYAHTSDDVVFTVWADRQGIPPAERTAARAGFFAVGRPCLRASDLGKRYGWGIHYDARARVALVAMGSAEYNGLAAGTAADGTPVTVLRAMRTRRR